jgi:hypothetical protein
MDESDASCSYINIKKKKKNGSQMGHINNKKQRRSLIKQ